MRTSADSPSNRALGDGPRGFGLADAGGTEQQQRGEGTVAAKAGVAAAKHRRDPAARLRVPDHPLGESILEQAEPLVVVPQQLLGRHARGVGHDGRDVARRDLPLRQPLGARQRHLGDGQSAARLGPFAGIARGQAQQGGATSGEKATPAALAIASRPASTMSCKAAGSGGESSTVSQARVRSGLASSNRRTSAGVRVSRKRRPALAKESNCRTPSLPSGPNQAGPSSTMGSRRERTDARTGARHRVSWVRRDHRWAEGRIETGSGEGREQGGAARSRIPRRSRSRERSWPAAGRATVRAHARGGAPASAAARAVRAGIRSLRWRPAWPRPRRAAAAPARALAAGREARVAAALSRPAGSAVARVTLRSLGASCPVSARMTMPRSFAGSIPASRSVSEAEPPQRSRASSRCSDVVCAAASPTAISRLVSATAAGVEAVLSPHPRAQKLDGRRPRCPAPRAGERRPLRSVASQSECRRYLRHDRQCRRCAGPRPGHGHGPRWPGRGRLTQTGRARPARHGKLATFMIKLPGWTRPSKKPCSSSGKSGYIYGLKPQTRGVRC